MTIQTHRSGGAHHSRLLLFALLTAGAALYPLGAYAQTPSESEDDTVRLPTFTVSTVSDKGYRAGNSVSATRVDTPIKDLPFAVSAFTAQFITDISSRDLFDVVQYSGSVTSAGREFGAGNAVYTIRGFDQPPQKDGFVGQPYVDTVSIERVEVVKGPASVLYGQVSPGGTVNFITKKPQANPFYNFTEKIGSYGFRRATADLNQPIISKKLLFRVNTAFEDGIKYIEPGASRTWVVAPTLTWKIADRVSLNVDYSVFRRNETPSAQFLPNIEVVAKAPASGILSSSGVLAHTTAANGDQQDPGFLGYYPFSNIRTFNYASNHDWRHSMFESLNAELTVGLGNHWTSRFNFNINNSNSSQKLTGLGNVSVDVPPSYYATAVNPAAPTAAEYASAAAAYAAALLNDPNLALNAPHAQLSRRQRLQEGMSHGKAFQGEAAGKYEFGDVKFKPLVGAYYDQSAGINRTRQTGSAGAYGLYQGTSSANTVATPAPWDFKNPTLFPINYDTDFDPVTIPLTGYTYAQTFNKAVYGIMNMSFFQDRLSLIAGARYSRAATKTKNYLAASEAVAWGPEVEVTNTSPETGLGYKVTKDMLVYTSYSESFRQSQANLQINSQPGTNAKPTTSKGYEAGIKTDFFDGRLSSTVAVYRIDQRNRVVRFNSFGPTGATVTNETQGIADRSEGIEAEITYSILNNWQVFVSGAIDDIRVSKTPPELASYLGTHPEATVRDLANLWTRYNFTGSPLKGLWIGAGFNYTGKKAQRVNNPALFLPATTIYNAAVGYDWKYHKMQFSATVNWENISNEQYFPANQQRGMPERIGLTLAQKF
jgi:iron complex outermembrane receptor protein